MSVMHSDRSLGRSILSLEQRAYSVTFGSKKLKYLQKDLSFALFHHKNIYCSSGYMVSTKKSGYIVDFSC